MKKIWKSLYQLILIGSVALVVGSCTNDETSEFTLSRKFMPSTIKTTNGPTSATIAWTATLFTLPGEANYVVEVSRDSAEFSIIDFTTTTQELQVVVTDKDVPFLKKKLFARIKTVGNDVTTESNWKTTSSFMITGEQLFLPLASSNITDVSVILSFQPSPDFTKIVLTPVGGGTPVEITITPTESAAGSKQIDNLIANSSYVAVLFKGELDKGTIPFSTKPTVTGTLVTDPNGLAAAMNAAPAGSILLLKRGVDFLLSASYSFNKSLTIMSAYELGVPAQAKINNSSFNIVANSIIDSIVFRDIFIYTPDVNTGKYGFNISTVCTVKKIRFDNCRVKNVRSLARAQTGGAGAAINNLFITNCVVDSVRDFGVVGQSGASSFNNITVQNSTFYKAQKFIISSSTATTNASVTIKNCTFNDLPTGGADKAPPVVNYFIDYGATAGRSPGSIVLQNCILGKSRSDFLSPPSTTAAGTRVTNAPSVTNCYATSDFLVTAATALPTTTFSKPSTALWVDPKNGDFHFKDLTFPAIGSAGDPRWRP